MKFRYQARTKEGEVKTGIVEASSREIALSLLQRHGLFITVLEEVGKEIPLYARRISFFERISKRDLVLFSRQLSIMFKAKVSLTDALDTLANQVKNQSFKEKIIDIAQQVKGGASFSQALSQFPDLFSTFYVSMVRSGEASGNLAESLEYLADHLEREYYLRSKTMGALIYPVLIVVTMIVVLVVIMIFVIPQLTEILQSSQQELPLNTKFVIWLSEFLSSWWWAILLFFGGTGIFIFRYIKTKEGKELIDKNIISLPVIGRSVKTIYLGRFAENLATLVSGGLPIARSLEITADVVGNTVYREAILKARDGVVKGESISAVLSQFPDIFPPVFTQMVKVGEKSGTLDTTLMEVVEFYRKEVEQSIENLLNLMEPLLIIFLGLVVGGLVGSVLIPFYNMAGL